MHSLMAHLESNNNLEIALIERKLTVKYSIDSGNQLVKFDKVFGESNTIKMITRLIRNTTEYFNADFSDAQLMQTALAIIDRFGYDNIEDIVIALKNARQGLCEKVFGKVNGEIVTKWIEKYMDLKAAEIEKQHHNKKAIMVEIHDKILDKINQARAKRKKLESTQTREEWVRKFKARIHDYRNNDLYENLIALSNDNQFKQNDDLIEIIQNEIKKRKTI